MSLAVELLLQVAQREPQLRSRIPNTWIAAQLLTGLRGQLSQYAWPGNVRELQNVVERIAVELVEADEGDLSEITLSELFTIAPELFEVSPEAEEDGKSLRERSQTVEVDEIRS